MGQKNEFQKFVGKFLTVSQNFDFMYVFVKGISKTEPDWLIYDWFLIDEIKGNKFIQISYNVEGWVNLKDAKEISRKKYTDQIKKIKQILTKTEKSYLLSEREVLIEKI